MCDQSRPKVWPDCDRIPYECVRRNTTEICRFCAMFSCIFESDVENHLRLLIPLYQYVAEMKLVIVGGSDAGISAALRAKELRPDVEVVVILADSYPNFSICGIPFYISKEVTHWRNLAHRTVSEIEALGITLKLNERVVHIAPDRKEVTGELADGTYATYAYDTLIIGTGAKSIRPPIRGLDQEGVFTLRWIDEMRAIDEYIDSHEARSAIIVGGGYIGLEMADALTLRGLQVHLVEYAPTVLTTVDAPFGKLVGEKLLERGVEVTTGTLIQQVIRNNRSLYVEGASSFKAQADLVLVAVGAQPETALAESVGIQTGVKGALKVNRRMETSIPHVYAAGDCVETWHQLAGVYTYLPLGTTAHKQGRIAGENAVGGSRVFAGSLGTQSVKLFDLVVARTGLHDRDAEHFGLSSLTQDAEYYDHKVYYPEAKPLRIRITGDPSTGQLLGGQLLGSVGTEVSKRVDILATAVMHGMSVKGLSDLDLSYTPPLSSPWDPLQMAAQAWGDLA